MDMVGKRHEVQLNVHQVSLVVDTAQLKQRGHVTCEVVLATGRDR